MAQEDLARELFALEKEYWQAMKNRDADVAVRLSDDPCIVAGAQGVSALPHAALSNMVNSTTYTLKDFELAEGHVRMIGTEVAILAYKVKEELTVDGKDMTLEAADASTWVRRGGEWLCVLHTESLLGDPFGRDRDGSEIPAAE